MTENNNLKQLFSYDLWGNDRITKALLKEKSLQNIVQHVIIHGQHHRAQIALLLGQSGKNR